MKLNKIFIFISLTLFFVGCSNKSLEKCESEIIKNKILNDNMSGMNNTPAYQYFKENLNIKFYIENIKNVKTTDNKNECSADLILEYHYIKESEKEDKLKLIRSIGMNKVGDISKEKHDIKFILTLDKNGKTIIN